MKCIVTCPFARGHHIDNEDGELVFSCRLKGPNDPTLILGKYPEFEKADCSVPAEEFCRRLAQHIEYAQFLLDKRRAEQRGE